MKKHSGKYTFDTSRNGSCADVAMKLFKQMAGVSATHVPFKTTSQGQIDVMGGQAPSIEPITGPSVASFSKFEVISWTGVFAPKRVPAEEVTAMQRAIRDLLSDAAFGADMVKRGQALAEQGAVGEVGRAADRGGREKAGQ
jgi:tripartite-type tricarboxylate transporter receptor subunit TctC